MHRLSRLLPLLALLTALPACQQKMAKQPYYRPYEESKFFENKMSARPLEAGVIHRDQRFSNDPLVTGLTVVGQKRNQDRERLSTEEGDPAADKRWALETTNYSDKFPFPMTKEDLVRGAERYTAFCVECHGVLGNGNGKIVERGFLRPPSYHVVKLQDNEPDEKLEADRGHPRGYSRGFARWGQKVRLDQVPVGYIFEVITNGYGGMAEHGSQIPPADRWRIAAYVRTLQFSRNTKLADLPEAIQKDAEQALAKAKGATK